MDRGTIENTTVEFTKKKYIKHDKLLFKFKY